uniref:Tuftelin interacting protein 11 n=1 Tax=Hucho hucho TaxID=62062 RepID=A0A4W5MJL3_9TELE
MAKFNPERCRHRQTKKEAIWGGRDGSHNLVVFIGSVYSLNTRSKDYSAPVNFVSAGLLKSAAEEKQHQQRGGGSDDSDNDNAPPREPAPKKLQTGGNFRRNSQSQRTGFAAGIRAGGDLGIWEKRTKGIVQKLLQKMDIKNPIEAKLRKGAVGSYDNERPKQSLQDFPVVDSEEEEEFQRELGQWRRDTVGGEGKKKPKVFLQDCRRYPETDFNMEQKVCYNYSPMTNKLSVPEEAPMSVAAREQKTPGFALPELEHNLQLLIDLTEQDLLQSSRRLQYERDVVVTRELQSADEGRSLLKMENNSGPSIEPCGIPFSLFATLQSEFCEEYKTLGLGDLAVAVVHPLIRETTHMEPSQGTHTLPCLLHLQLWRHHQVCGSRCCECVCVSGWQPRMVGPIVDCVEVWAPLLPLWILNHILEQLIFPRLQREVDSWNSLTDTVPIHSWLHPWLPLLQSWVEPLYLPIRSKLANALQRWHPSDGSFHTSCSASPLIALCLGELLINLQQMETFNWVLDWEGMLSPSSLVSLLDKHFFPKWLQVYNCFLCLWFSNSPNYEEITKWYLGWKSMFSDAVLAQPLIKDKFNGALDIMNRAVSSNLGGGGYMQPGARESIAYLIHTERRKDFQYEALQERRDAESVAQRGIGASLPTNFKDLIQTKAEENNIVFMPLVAKRHEGASSTSTEEWSLYRERSPGSLRPYRFSSIWPSDGGREEGAIGEERGGVQE